MNYKSLSEEYFLFATSRLHVPGDSMKSFFIKTVSKEGGKAEGFDMTELQKKAGGFGCNMAILN